MLTATVGLASLTEYACYDRTAKPLTCVVNLNIEAHLICSDTKEPCTRDQLHQAHTARQPHEIVLVCDQSDSMASNMPMMKKVLQYIIETSTSHDRFGLVTFSTEAHVLRRCEAMKTEDDRQEFRRTVQAIEASGNTNLLAGIMLGLDLFSDAANTSRYLIVLTDGMANEGVKKTSAMVEHIERHKMIGNTTLIAMGMGSFVNEDLLHTLARSCHGKLYSLHSSDDIATSFGDCMGSVLSTALDNVHVKIEVPDKATIVPQSRGASVLDKNLVEYVIGPMRANESRNLLFTITFFEHPFGDAIHLARVVVDGFDMWQNSVVQKECDVIASLSDTTGSRDNRVELQQIRVNVANYMHNFVESKDAAVQSMLAQALNDSKLQLTKSEWTEMPLCQEIIGSIQEFFDAMQSSGLAGRQISGLAGRQISHCLSTEQNSLSRSTTTGTDDIPPHPRLVRTISSVDFSDPLAPLNPIRSTCEYSPRQPTPRAPRLPTRSISIYSTPLQRDIGQEYENFIV